MPSKNRSTLAAFPKFATIICFTALAVAVAACGKSPRQAALITPAPVATVVPTTSAAAQPTLLAPTPGGTTTAAPAPTPAPQISPVPVPAGDRIHLVTSTSTTTYAVFGSTTDEILSYIGNYGPLDDQGQRATGLTQTNWSLHWDNNHDAKACAVATMTIQLEVKVTLPALDHPERLSQALQASWAGFAAAIAAHEQHHVDISLAGSSALKTKMSALTPRTSCTTLESDVNDTWSAQQARTASEQTQFHAEDQARIASLRDPIKSQIDANRSKIDAFRTAIGTLDASLTELSTQISTLSNNLNVLKSQMTAIETQYQGQTMPPAVTQQYDSLRQQYNALVPAYNALVDNYNATLARRNSTASDSEALRLATNDLVDRYNWTR